MRRKNTSEKAVQKKEARGRKETVEEVEHFSVLIIPSVLWKATLMRLCDGGERGGHEPESIGAVSECGVTRDARLTASLRVLLCLTCATGEARFVVTCCSCHDGDVCARRNTADDRNALSLMCSLSQQLHMAAVTNAIIIFAN